MSSYGGPVLIFLAMFSLLSFLIGLLTSIICETEVERKSSLIFYGTSAVSIIVLALLVYPYYGIDFAKTLMAAGIPVYFIGSLFAPSARARGFSSAFILMLISLLVELAIIIGLFIVRILPIDVAVILLFLVALLWGLGAGFALMDIVKGVINWIKKHGKAHAKKGISARSSQGKKGTEIIWESVAIALVAVMFPAIVGTGIRSAYLAQAWWKFIFLGSFGAILLVVIPLSAFSIIAWRHKPQHLEKRENFAINAHIIVISTLIVAAIGEDIRLSLGNRNYGYFFLLILFAVVTLLLSFGLNHFVTSKIEKHLSEKRGRIKNQ